MTTTLAGRLPGLLLHDLPPFAAAMATAEFAFKFGSFTLECLAFLALWWALAHGWRWVLAALGVGSAGAGAGR